MHVLSIFSVDPKPHKKCVLIFPYTLAYGNVKDAEKKTSTSNYQYFKKHVPKTHINTNSIAIFKAT